MTYATPEEAAKAWRCPLARTFAEKKGPNCMGPECPIWRWRPLSADDPAFKAAVSAEMSRLADEAGAKSNMTYHREAVARIMADRAAYGLPDRPTHGWCGLGGEPKV